MGDQQSLLARLLDLVDQSVMNGMRRAETDPGMMMLVVVKRLPWRDHPANNVTAEDVQDQVEIEVGPLDWAQQLGDIPAPDLGEQSPTVRV